MARFGDVLVLTGGDGAGTTSPTWTWSGSAWTQLDVSGPPLRFQASMAPSHGKLVLFGGIDAHEANLSDTWTWDGTAWEGEDTVGPSARGCAGLATP
jgi:hypothetical protein